MFPEEIYVEILLRLPVKSACVCKCVSKTWSSLISNPRFAKSHLDLTLRANKPSLILQGRRRSMNPHIIYSINHDSLPSLLSRDVEFMEYAVEIDYPFKSFSSYSVDLQGCCDGLVCLWFHVYGDSNKNFLCLWNPATKEYKKLPKSPNSNDDDDDDDDDTDISMIGLCYDSKNEDYKLVIGFDSVVNVYSLGLNSWSSIKNVPYEFSNYGEVGLLVNGDLHWLVEPEDSSQIVVCLDISDQIFKEIQLPIKSDEQMTLGLLDGCLCVHGHVTNSQSEVWVMQDYGIEESWTKRYIINHDRINKNRPVLMWSFKSGEMLFRLIEYDKLAIYDPKDESVREPNMHSLMKFEQEGCYCESLVSLRSGTYVGGEEVEEERENLVAVRMI